MQCFEFTESVKQGISVWREPVPRVSAYINLVTPTCVLSAELREFDADENFLLRNLCGIISPNFNTR